MLPTSSLLRTYLLRINQKNIEDNSKVAPFLHSHVFVAFGSFLPIIYLESPDNQRARKAAVVYMQDRGFNSFASNVIELSVNETKWSSSVARTRALILYSSLYFDLNI